MSGKNIQYQWILLLAALETFSARPAAAAPLLEILRGSRVLPPIVAPAGSQAGPAVVAAPAGLPAVTAAPAPPPGGFPTPTFTLKTSVPGASRGGEFTLKLTPFFELGGSFDKMFMTYSDGAHGSERFYGLIAHLRIPGLYELRLDARVGLSQRTLLDADHDISSGFAPQAGLGLSYPIRLAERLFITPQVGLRWVRNAASGFEPGPTGMLAEFGIVAKFKF